MLIHERKTTSVWEPRDAIQRTAAIHIWCFLSGCDHTNALHTKNLRLWLMDKCNQRKVDGSFLGELRESDLMDSIGMEHKLHLKKLLLARQKLTPLTAAEQSMASSVRREESATAAREGIPDIDTAFSQVRSWCCARLL